MKKLCVLSLVILLSVALVSIDVLATGVSLTGIGGRATVFGGAFRGIANDWSAGYWNPAGLVQIQKWQFGGSFEFIGPTACYNPSLLNGQQYGTLAAGEKNCEDQYFYVPSGGIVYNTGDLAFGLAVFAPFGLGTKWDLFNTGSYNSSYPVTEFDDELTIIDIHPSFAFKVSDKLSIGVGLSFIHADIRIQQPNVSQIPYLSNPQLAGLSQMLQANGASFNSTNSYIMTDVNLDGSGWGYGGNIGLMYKATDDLQIGVSARYYLDNELDGSFTGTTYFANDPVNNAVNQAVLGQAVAGGLLDQATAAQLGALFSGASAQTINDQSAKATMPLPMNIGIGFAYTGVENLLLTMDVDFTQWSSWDVIKIDMSDGTENELVENWDDVIRLAFGFEYTMEELQLRGGFYTENPASVDETFSPTIPDVGRRNVIIGGLGYDMGNIKLHVSGEYFFVGDRTVSDWASDGAGGWENYAGMYSASTFTLMGGFEFNF
jgi:long-chain fatty acid transport protein